MAPGLLMPECVVHAAGCGPAFEVGAEYGHHARVVLRVTHTVPHESLAVFVVGSPDGVHWPGRPLAAFRKSCLNGCYEAEVDLTGIRYLRAEWQVDRWDRSQTQALFGFSLELTKLARAAGT